MTDEQLVKLFQGGDKAAGEQLLVGYKNKVLKSARRFYLLGGETEDLVQEGMCGLFSAMVNYNFTVPFSAYASVCITNRIKDAVKSDGRMKNVPLNTFSPIDEDADKVSSDPEQSLLDSEGVSEFYGKMKECLSAFEFKITCLYLDGVSLSEIADACGKPYKAADNALARAKRKLRKVFTEE